MGSEKHRDQNIFFEEIFTIYKKTFILHAASACDDRPLLVGMEKYMLINARSTTSTLKAEGGPFNMHN